MYQPPEQPQTVWDHQWNADETVQSSAYPPPPPYYPPPSHRSPQKPSINQPLTLIIALAVIFMLGFSVYLASALGLYGSRQSITYDDTTTPDTPTATLAATATSKPTIAPTKPAGGTTPVSSGPGPASHKTGVNGNPWGYDFNPGDVIASPPGDFCAYFACIASFWSGNGYVMECQDQTYSKSGGIRGSCSRHGGDMRPLYQHPAGAIPCMLHQFVDVTPEPSPDPQPSPSPEASPTLDPSPTPLATPTIPVTRTPAPTPTPWPTNTPVPTATPSC